MPKKGLPVFSTKKNFRSACCFQCSRKPSRLLSTSKTRTQLCYFACMCIIIIMSRCMWGTFIMSVSIMLEWIESIFIEKPEHCSKKKGWLWAQETQYIKYPRVPEWSSDILNSVSEHLECIVSIFIETACEDSSWFLMVAYSEKNTNVMETNLVVSFHWQVTRLW